MSRRAPNTTCRVCGESCYPGDDVCSSDCHPEWLGIKRGAAIAFGLMGMFEAIAARYERCWFCGETNVLHTSDADHCTRCNAVLAYA